MKTFFLSLLSICCIVSAMAKDPPPLHLTGVPQVDFFSTRDLRTASFTKDSLPVFSSISSDPASKKSPWLAAALSFVVPGAGEVYAGNYLKGAIFFGIEVGSWFTVYTYNKKGDDQTAIFEQYANDYWNPVRYALWTYDHNTLLTDNEVTADSYDLFYGADMDSLRDNPGSPPFSNVNWDQLNEYERDVADAKTNGYTHTLPYYAQQQYYELIGKYIQFYSGWDDAQSGSTAIGDVLPSDFTPSPDSRYKIYSNMRSKANDYYDIAHTMISVIVLNHVISALDAAWTAARFNRSLEAHVGLRLQQTPFGVVPVKEAYVRWTF